MVPWLIAWYRYQGYGIHLIIPEYSGLGNEGVDLWC